MSATPTDPREALRRPRSRARMAWLAPVIALAVVAAGCGDKDPLTGTVVKDALGCQPSEVDRSDDVPTIEPGTEVGKKVGKTDEKKGKGCTAGAEAFSTLDMVGATAKDGKTFVNTFEKDGRPLTVTLGQGKLVAGLESGIQGMKVGGRRTITVPADQAYGKEGNEAQGIGKDEPLVFTVDLVGVTQTPIYCAKLTDFPTEKDGKPIKGKNTDVKLPTKVPTSEVDTRDLEVGKGKKVDTNGYVKVNYYGISCLTGKQFATSYDEEGGDGSPLTAALGSAKPTAEVGSVIPGWTAGLKGARVGTIRQLDIPYQLAYGAQGRGTEDLGPYASLVFVIEVLDAYKKLPETPATTTTAPGATTTTAAGKDTTTTAAKDTTTTAGKTTSTTAAQTGTTKD